MTAAGFELRVGVRVWLDGQGWEVAELDGATVRLLANGRLRTVSVASLANAFADDPAPGPRPSDDQSWKVPAVVLAALSTKQRDALQRQVAVLRQVLEPPSGDDRPVAERYAAAAAELGISRRTLQRQLARLREQGPAGLVDARKLQDLRRTVDPRWDVVCREILDSYTSRSNPTMQTVIDQVNRRFSAAAPDGVVPSRSVAYLRLGELDHGRYTFGVAKQRRSVAKRPTGVLGRLRADRPGQYVLLDSYRLDVFAMEPVTLRWVNTELTVAMDLFDRCITGVRLRPVAARSPDVASVLFQTVTPQTWGWAAGSPEGPYAGLPDGIVLGDPGGVLPDTIVVDHGKIYLSEDTRSVCERLGISIQPAIPDKPTDKPALERFFRTLRQSLLEQLPGYKGPDVASRGKDVEGEAFYYVGELEQLIREWVGRVYHHTAHAGLVDPLQPRAALSPTEMFARGVAAAGRLRLPASADLVYDFLEVEWRTIQHYGVEIDGQRYDGPGVNDYRGTKSPYGGAHPGKWPFMVDRDDIRAVFFRDPTTGGWSRLEWEHAAGVDAPFSADAARYVRALAARENRHVDPQQAVQDLLADWARGEVTTRRDRNLALRLATQRAAAGDGADAQAAQDRDTASTPGVVDLLARRQHQTELRDDLNDVFARYYATHPDSDGLEVFDE
ncbi:helix-turn-helix domain-containing protein [Microlunatus lacustris]